MLTNLLRAAAEFDSIAPVVAGLRAIVAEFDAAYARFAAGGDPCAAVAAAWRARGAGAVGLLGHDHVAMAPISRNGICGERSQ
jgi:hypothetical protein